MPNEVDKLRLIVELLRAMTYDLERTVETLEQREQEREAVEEEWA